MNMRSLKFFLLTLFMMATVPANAGPFDDGRAAELRGDYASAMASYKTASKHGHAEAKMSLGSMYLDGRGVKRNPKIALKWLSESAEGGSVGALRLLGVMYDGAPGVNPNPILAYKWYGLAASKGDSEAGALLNNLKYQIIFSQRQKAKKLIAQFLAKASPKSRRSERKRRRQ